MSEELPGGWEKARIRDRFKVWGGMTPSTSEPSFWGGSIPWISSKDVKSPRLKSGTEFVTAKALQATRLRKCRPGSILVVVRSGVLAHSLPVAVATSELVVNQDLKVFDSGDDSVNEWLAFYLRGHARDILNASRKDGTTVQSVRMDDLLDRELPLPPAHERDRIRERVEVLLGSVERTRSRLAIVSPLLKRFRQAVLVAACSGRLTESWREGRAEGLGDASREVNDTTVDDGVRELPDVPAHWGLVTVGDVVDRTQYGLSVKATTAESGVPVLRMGNIQNGNVDFSELKYVKSEAVSEDFLLQPGDVLFNRTNSPELVGKCAVYDKAGRATFASYLLRLQVNADLLAPQFLASWINSSWGRSWARAVRTDGVSQSNINATKLASMPLPLPPLREQHEIVRRTIALLKTADALDRRLSVAIRSTKRLGDSVLVKAFRGELSGIAAAERALS